MTLATLPSEARARPAHPTYTRAQALPALLRQRIVLLDGAMGTMLQQRKLDEAAFRGSRFADHPTPLKGNNELLNLTQPQVVREIHEAYLAAGSDILETNTFGATAIAQADYGLAHLAREMNVQATALARQACDRCSTPGSFSAAQTTGRFAGMIRSPLISIVVVRLLGWVGRVGGAACATGQKRNSRRGLTSAIISISRLPMPVARSVAIGSWSAGGNESSLPRTTRSAPTRSIR